jgi:hypothetical protein
VLAVTSERWLMVAEEEDGQTKVSGASFDDTLLVELTEILLFGQMKIDFVSDGKQSSSAFQFDLVEEEMYREAAHLILDAIEEVTPLANEQAFRDAVEYVSDWPLKFRHGVLKFIPKGRRLLFAIHWPALTGGFRRELAPAAALALTERELFLISEDKASGWFSRRKAPKYGYILTYLPRVRLAQHRISRQPKFALLELETHGSHGGEVLQIILPVQYESEVAECMERAAVVTAAAQQNQDNHSGRPTLPGFTKVLPSISRTIGRCVWPQRMKSASMPSISAVSDASLISGCKWLL